MKNLSELQQVFSQLSRQEPFSVLGLESLLTELNEYIYSADYDRLSFAEREQAQELLDSARNLLSLIPSTKLTTSTSDDNQGHNSEPSQGVDLHFAKHDDTAEEFMNKAEEYFYGGQYLKAIGLYEKVLNIEPGWERAIAHYQQAREYMLSGNIPSVALPSEAAIAYGKAQSAMRVGRYKDSLHLIEYAQRILAQNGITKWVDGQEFSIKLNELLQAEEIVKNAVEDFNKGQVDSAILALENVYREIGIPRHKDLAEKFRRFKDTYKQISEILLSPAAHQSIVYAVEQVESLRSEFEGNPLLLTLVQRFEAEKTTIASALIKEINRLISEADTAQTWKHW
jgi:tetratricopeptide (TPR) repeat protein